MIDVTKNFFCSRKKEITVRTYQKQHVTPIAFFIVFAETRLNINQWSEGSEDNPVFPFPALNPDQSATTT